MTDYLFEQIQGSITDRQYELQNVTDILASKAELVAKRALISKVVLIFLGALVATRETASQILPPDHIAIIILYTLMGLIIAVIAGLEAAFKWETRAAELRTLAAICQSTLRTVDSQWQKEIGTTSGEEKIAAAQKLLDLQDSNLSEVQTKAASLGVNITLEVRELQGEREVYAA